MQLWMQYALAGVGLEASHIAQYIFFRSSIRNALMTSVFFSYNWRFIAFFCWQVEVFQYSCQADMEIKIMH